MDDPKMARDTYTRWKAELADNGRTPADIVRFFRFFGQDEYADQLEAVIQEMEASLAGPA